LLTRKQELLLLQKNDIDAGGVQSRRILERILKAENQQLPAPDLTGVAP
jgi:hypothetical protein